jgi:hypothetical protein
MGKIKDKKLLSQKNIRDTDLSLNCVKDNHLRFSFKYLDMKHPKFSIKNQDARYVEKVLERFQGLSGMTSSEIKTSRTKTLRAHPIDWDKTSEPSGFSSLNRQLRETDAFQFNITSNEHGRIHGFFIDSIFFIVWFDPEHKLYPGN